MTTAPRIWLYDMFRGTASSEAGGVGSGDVECCRSSAISLGVAMREVNSNQNVAPSPARSDHHETLDRPFLDLTPSRPPESWTICLTIARPRPEPDVAEMRLQSQRDRLMYTNPTLV